VARFGAVTALPDLLMTLATCELRRDFSRACGARFTDLAASGNKSGRFDAAGPMRSPPRGREAQPHICTQSHEQFVTCHSTPKAVYIM
jgi:hypothetical protein